MFQSGDGRAFEDLYRRYFQRIYRYCLKRVGDPHEAEELAQEAFVRAYSAMPRLAGERRFYPWLTVIASRLCVDAHRRRGRTQPTARSNSASSTAARKSHRRGRSRDPRPGPRRMAPRHREVLRLREEEGWSYHRIAEHLGVSVGTVEALLFRARRALRREFHALAGADSRLAALPVIGYLIRRMCRRPWSLIRDSPVRPPRSSPPARCRSPSSSGAASSNTTALPTVAATAVGQPVVEITMPALTVPSIAPVPAAPRARLWARRRFGRRRAHRRSRS